MNFEESERQNNAIVGKTIEFVHYNNAAVMRIGFRDGTWVEVETCGEQCFATIGPLQPGNPPIK
jgi:hypothetical protein